MAVNLLVDPETGGILSVDSTVVDCFGYSMDQLGKMNISEVVLASAAEICEKIGHSTHLKKLSLQIREASGKLCGVRVYASLISIDQAGRLFMCIFEEQQREPVLNFAGSAPPR